MESELDKKQNWVDQLNDDVNKVLENLRVKDIAIESLTETIMNKASENQKLSENLSQLKNHMLNTVTFNQKYAVQR